MDTHLLIIGIAILAGGTYALRLAGVMLGRKMSFSEGTRALLSDAATTLLLAVAVIATLFEGAHFAGFARVLGVGVGLVLAWRKCPLIFVLLSAAAATALLRLAGIN